VIKKIDNNATRVPFSSFDSLSFLPANRYSSSNCLQLEATFWHSSTAQLYYIYEKLRGFFAGKQQLLRELVELTKDAALLFFYMKKLKKKNLYEFKTLPHNSPSLVTSQFVTQPFVRSGGFYFFAVILNINCINNLQWAK